jgi:hypothetical protein
MSPLHTAILVALAVCAIPFQLRAETPLGTQMDAMKGAFRNIRAALQAPSDADKEKYAGYVDALIAAAGKAKDFEPEKTAKIPEAERAQFLADYRQSIDALIALFEQLKSQLSAGDWDGARAQMRLISNAQADGHEKFRIEEF